MLVYLYELDFQSCPEKDYEEGIDKEEKVRRKPVRSFGQRFGWLRLNLTLDV